MTAAMDFHSPVRRLALLALIGLAARSALAQCPKTGPNSTYALPPLPLPTEGYEPVIDNATMFLHHFRHHQAYINNTNAALGRIPALKNVTLTRLIQRLGDKKWEALYGLDKGNRTLLRNNAGGHWNHAFFWKIMTSANATSPAASLSPALAALVDSTYGNSTALLDKLRAAGAAAFGSGWVWVVVRTDEAGAPSLDIVATANQDNPLMVRLLPKARRGTPILGIDIWEHAYYLRYRNVRAAYLAAWVQLINWDIVQRNYDLAIAGKYDDLYC